MLGTGAGGLAAAVTGADEGLSTLVLEKTDGSAAPPPTPPAPAGSRTTASSAPTASPTTHAVASRYLDALVGDRAPRELREAYLTRGPEMIDYFDGLGVRFWPSKKVVDYHPEVPGASLGGRALEPQTFDGRTLGKENFGRVRRPVPEFALFGGTLMVRRAEVNELLTIYKGSPRGVATALKLGVRWAADRLRYPRGTRLAMGNAFVANLFHRLLARGGRVWFNATATELLREDGRVVGAVVAHQGRELRVRARRGVVLAGGGFSASPEWRGRYLPSPTPQYTRAAEGATGATLGSPRPSAARWGSPATTTRSGSPAPSAAAATAPPRSSRTSGTAPSRASSRSTQTGRRFVDESVSYHRFVRAMYAAQAVPAWLVIDAAALRRYGLGMVRPHTPASAEVRRGGVPAPRARPCASWPRRSASTRTASPPPSPPPTGPPSPVWTRSSARGAACSATSTAIPSTGPTSTSARSRPRPSTRSPSSRPRSAPRSGCAPTRRPGCSTPRARRSPACTRAATTPQSVMGSEYPGAGCQVGAGLTFGYVAARHAAVPPRSRRTADRRERPSTSARWNPIERVNPVPDPVRRDARRPDHR